MEETQIANIVSSGTVLNQIKMEMVQVGKAVSFAFPVMLLWKKIEIQVLKKDHEARF